MAGLSANRRRVVWWLSPSLTLPHSPFLAGPASPHPLQVARAEALLHRHQGPSSEGEGVKLKCIDLPAQHGLWAVGRLQILGCNWQ